MERCTFSESKARKSKQRLRVEESKRILQLTLNECCVELQYNIFTFKQTSLVATDVGAVWLNSMSYYIVSH